MWADQIDVTSVSRREPEEAGGSRRLVQDEPPASVAVQTDNRRTSDSYAYS